MEGSSRYNTPLWEEIKKVLKNNMEIHLSHPQKPIRLTFSLGYLVQWEGEFSSVYEKAIPKVLQPQVLKGLQKTSKVTGKPLYSLLVEGGLLTPEIEFSLSFQGAITLLQDSFLKEEKPWLLQPIRSQETFPHKQPFLPVLVDLFLQVNPSLLIETLHPFTPSSFSPNPHLLDQLPEEEKNFLKNASTENDLKKILKTGGNISQRKALVLLFLAKELGWFLPPSTREISPPPTTQKKPFYEDPPPEDLYERLGISEGAQGQGIASAYSQRLTVVRDLLKKKPGDPHLEKWQKALLLSYRILTNPSSRALYNEIKKERKENAEKFVIQEMAKRSLSEGLQLLKKGDRYGGIRFLQESLSWDEKNPLALAIVGIHQILLGEGEEGKEGYTYLSRALKMNPGDPYIRYLHSITAYYFSDMESFQEDRKWMENQKEKAPPAFSSFLKTVFPK